LREELEAISTSVGGSGFKFFIGLGLSIIISLYMLAALQHMQQTRTLKYWWVPILCVGMFALMFFSPLHELLDGFLLVKTDPSFLVRYQSELALVALIVGIVSLVLQHFMSKKDANRPENQPPTHRPRRRP